MIKEKGLQHAGAALSFAHTALDKGQLEIKRAVFLPLSSTVEALPIGSKYDFQLLLHGYYLLDAGRKEIHKGKTWNELLERRGALRQVLPALDDLNHSSQLPADELYRLTEGLCAAPFLTDRIKEICAEHQWL